MTQQIRNYIKSFFKLCKVSREINVTDSFEWESQGRGLQGPRWISNQWGDGHEWLSDDRRTGIRYEISKTSFQVRSSSTVRPTSFSTICSFEQIYLTLPLDVLQDRFSKNPSTLFRVPGLRPVSLTDLVWLSFLPSSLLQSHRFRSDVSLTIPK